jgi:hypothetical protein
MGYEIIRLDTNKTVMAITDIYDENYFRINIWGMIKAHTLALWGIDEIDLSTVLEVLSHDPQTVDSVEHMNTWQKQMLGSPFEDFLYNFRAVLPEKCKEFSEGLGAAFSKIDDSAVAIEKLTSETNYERELCDFLNHSPNGVWIE